MQLSGKPRAFVLLSVIIIVAMLLFPSCYGIPIKRKEKMLKIDHIIDNDTLVLDGTIIADIDDNKLRAVRPSINLTNGQNIYFNISEMEGEKYFIDKTLHIDIDVVNNTTHSTLFGRYITTCIVLLRKNQSFGSGFLKNLFIGKILNINRTNVFSEGEKCIEIPLSYETDKPSENIVMHVLAMGTIIGIISNGQPIIAHEKIDLEFIYTFDNPQDTTPPVTICILDGEEN